MKLRYLLLFISIPCLCLSQNEPEYYGKEQGKKLDWAIYYLNEYYVDSINTNAVVEEAIRTIAAQLDPYSVYQTAEELRKQKEADEGIQSTGIGINLITIDKLARITSIMPESPAAKADLQKGDIIFEIENESMANVAINDILQKLNGEIGTSFNLSIIRDAKLIPKTITRTIIPWVSVEATFMIDSNIGYIKLIKFTQKTIEEFTSAYLDLVAKGMTDLILDLRGNNGGVFTAAIDLASQFLETDQLIVYTDGVVTEREDYHVKEQGPIQSGKIVALTDGITASASEVFIGALQDWDRALVLGSPSFGKGLIQQSYGFSDNSALRLTIGKYFRPSGQSVQRNNNKTLVLPSRVYVGSETHQFIESEGFHLTKSGRKIYSLGAGIIPDVFYPQQAVKAPNIPYKNIASYFFANKHDLKERLSHYNDLLTDKEFNQLVSSADPEISSKDKAEVTGWMAALLFKKDNYYQSISSEDKVIMEAVKRLKDDTFDRLGIRF